ncbi:hypothetical protein Tco_0366540 [Tanacetum coccineum]
MCAKGWRGKTRFNISGIKTYAREYEHKPPINLLEGRGTESGTHVDNLGNFQLLEDVLRVATGASGEDLGGDRAESSPAAAPPAAAAQGAEEEGGGLNKETRFSSRAPLSVVVLRAKTGIVRVLEYVVMVLRLQASRAPTWFNVRWLGYSLPVIDIT